MSSSRVFACSAFHFASNESSISVSYLAGSDRCQFGDILPVIGLLVTDSGKVLCYSYDGATGSKCV